MSEKVVGLRGALVPQVMPANPDVIEMLEDTLERARSGQILGVSMVFQEYDECCGNRRAGLLSIRLLGATHMMAAEMVEELKNL